MKRKRAFLLSGALLIIIGLFGYYKFSEKTEKSVQSPPEFKLTSEEILQLYSTNQEETEAKFLGRVIEITGPVVQVVSVQNGVNIEIAGPSSLETITCTLDYSVYDSMDLPAPSQVISVKGNCSGFITEDMFGMKNVNLTQCSITNL